MLRFRAREAFLSASVLLPSMSSSWACTIFCYVSMYITILVSSCLIICKSWVWMVYLFSIDDSSCTQQNSWPSKKENACKEQGTQRQDIVVVFFPCNEPIKYRCEANIRNINFGFGNLAPVWPADAWVMRKSREYCNIFTWFHIDSRYLYTVVEWYLLVALCLPVNLPHCMFIPFKYSIYLIICLDAPLSMLFNAVLLHFQYNYNVWLWACMIFCYGLM